MPGGQRGLQSAGVFVMLTILFKILSILGIVLLILLGIALVVIALVLFFPIFYKAEGKKNSEELWLTVRAKWLFGLLRCSYDYPDPGKLQVKLLFSTLYDSSVEKPQKDTDASEDAPTEETAKAAAAVAEVTPVAEPRETGSTHRQRRSQRIKQLTGCIAFLKKSGARSAKFVIKSKIFCKTLLFIKNYGRIRIHRDFCNMPVSASDIF